MIPTTRIISTSVNACVSPHLLFRAAPPSMTVHPYRLLPLVRKGRCRRNTISRDFYSPATSLYFAVNHHDDAQANHGKADATVRSEDPRLVRGRQASAGACRCERLARNRRV